MDLLQDPDLTGDEMDEYINLVKISGQRLINTINDIIDISRIESGAIKVTEGIIDFNQILLEQYNFFKYEAEKKKLSLTVSLLPSGKDKLRSDRYKLESILINLIKNAIKFTNRGSIHIDSQIMENHLIFSVTDTGIGIAPENLVIVFDRFVQADNSLSRDYEGSGLGLSICRSYAELMGGTIDVTSEVLKGTSFKVSLPYKPANIESAVDTFKPESKPDPIDGGVILVTEDDEISFLFFKTAIRKLK